MSAVPEPRLDPEIARRANRLGLYLGAACLALTGAFIIIFMVNGLPKDPAAYRRLLNQQEAQRELGAAGAPGAAGQKPVDQKPVDQKPVDQHPADQH